MVYEILGQIGVPRGSIPLPVAEGPPGLSLPSSDPLGPAAHAGLNAPPALSRILARHKAASCKRSSVLLSANTPLLAYGSLEKTAGKSGT